MCLCCVCVCVFIYQFDDDILLSSNEVEALKMNHTGDLSIAIVACIGIVIGFGMS